MIWFDGDELGELPKRPVDEIAGEKWKEELRQMQRRREDREFYQRMMYRRVPVVFDAVISAN